MDLLLNIAGWTAFVCLVLGFLWFAWMIGEDFPIAGILFAVFVVACAVIGGYAIYDEGYHDHPTYQLRKANWFCSARHTEVRTTYISNGRGGLTPLVTSEVVCDQYNRKD